jgi:lysophospholipid acyltransferase (LPLAT)-like uncharacterized protein
VPHLLSLLHEAPGDWVTADATPQPRPGIPVSHSHDSQVCCSNHITNALSVVRTARVTWPAPPTDERRVWTVWHGQALVLVLAFVAARPGRLPHLVGLNNRRGAAIRLAYESLGGGGLLVTDRVKGGPRGVGREHIVEHLRHRGSCLVTPDGPVGPDRVAKPGGYAVALAAGVPVVHLEFRVRRKVRLRRWDRFEMPLPFTVIEVVTETPVPLGRPAEEVGHDYGDRPAGRTRAAQPGTGSTCGA